MIDDRKPFTAGMLRDILSQVPADTLVYFYDEFRYVNVKEVELHVEDALVADDSLPSGINYNYTGKGVFLT